MFTEKDDAENLVWLFAPYDSDIVLEAIVQHVPESLWDWAVECFFRARTDSSVRMQRYQYLSSKRNWLAQDSKKI